MNEIDRLRAAPPRPPAELRDQVVARATMQLELEDLPGTHRLRAAIDAIWFNRRLRLAWLVSTVVLIALDFALTEPLPVLSQTGFGVQIEAPR